MRAENAQKNSADDAPSLELLQFLGEWETHDGKWVDPIAFGALTHATEDAFAEPETKKEEQDHEQK
ncbi:MAG: hypothetical protein AABY83_05465 [Pseudomonadota bacterium]